MHVYISKDQLGNKAIFKTTITLLMTVKWYFFFIYIIIFKYWYNPYVNVCLHFHVLWRKQQQLAYHFWIWYFFGFWFWLYGLWSLTTRPLRFMHSSMYRERSSLYWLTQRELAAQFPSAPWGIFGLLFWFLPHKQWSYQPCFRQQRKQLFLLFFLWVGGDQPRGIREWYADRW